MLKHKYIVSERVLLFPITNILFTTIIALYLGALGRGFSK